MSKETFVGDTGIEPIPNDPSDFDYPKFSADVYSIETIVAEKTRAILQRGYIRDYYDVWRLFKEKKFDQKQAKKIFEKKCKAKGVEFSNVDDFFPTGIADILRKHLPDLMRLTRDPLPDLDVMLAEIRQSLEKFLK